MPVTTSAAKALRRDRRRTSHNLIVRAQLRTQIKIAKQLKTPEAINEAYSVIDKAAQRGIIHPNKAARLKSQLALIPPAIKRTSPPTKKVTKKSKTAKKNP